MVGRGGLFPRLPPEGFPVVLGPLNGRGLFPIFLDLKLMPTQLLAFGLGRYSYF